jgi:hypothetical protein
MVGRVTRPKLESIRGLNNLNSRLWSGWLGGFEGVVMGLRMGWFVIVVIPAGQGWADDTVVSTRVGLFTGLVVIVLRGYFRGISA